MKRPPQVDPITDMRAALVALAVLFGIGIYIAKGIGFEFTVYMIFVIVAAVTSVLFD